MKITNMYVINAHFCLFAGGGNINSCGYESGIELSVGKTQEVLNFSCNINALSKEKEGRNMSGDGLSLIGKEIVSFGVSQKENLVIIFPNGEREDYEIQFSTKPLAGGQHEVFYGLVKIVDDSPFENIYNNGYVPRRISIPGPAIGFIFQELKNEEEFNIEDEIKKLFYPDGTFYASGYGDSAQNRLRPSLAEDPRQAFNQVFAILFVLFGENGHWRTLLTVEAPNGKRGGLFSILRQALEETIGELVEIGLAEIKDPIITMKRWRVYPPRDIDGESQTHDVLASHHVIARAGV